MSLHDDARHRIGGNKPPVNPPSEQELLDDLKQRYPRVTDRIVEFEAALAKYPEEIHDEPTAKALQDLLGQMKDERSSLKGIRSEQKKPWDKLAKVVMNFFSTAEDKIEGWESVWRPRLSAYADEKAAAAKREAEEALEREKAKAEEARRIAEEAEWDRIWAEARAELAEWNERAAIKAQHEAEERKRQAEEAAKLAAEQAKQAEREKAAREKAERERNAEALKQIRQHLKTAAKLHEDGITDETPQPDIDQLDALLRIGSPLSVLVGQIMRSSLLDHEQVLEVEQAKLQIGNMRHVLEERLDAKARRKREKERKAQEKADKEAAEEREARRKADETAALAAQDVRDKALREAEEAKAQVAQAKKEARTASQEANEAASDVKEATRAAGRADQDAERVENRAGRMERKVEGSTPADYSRTRGDLGTVGSQSRRWVNYVADEAAIRAACGPLGPFLASDAIEAATFKIMRARQSGFTGDLVTCPDLPGVEFRYEIDLTIRT